MKKFFLLVVLFSSFSGAVLAQPSESPAQRDARMKWWRDARFGMFIHWGAYARPAGMWDGRRVDRSGGEWIMTRAPITIPEYEKIVHAFNPTAFDADEWVRLARDAGMRYIVITSKHHDGFAIYDSDVSPYDFPDATPFKRDALAELAAACRRYGMKLGFYYSIMDWHHPDAQGPNYPDYNQKKSNPNFARYVNEYMKPQLRELLTNYGDIAVLWFDGDWIADWSDEWGWDIYTYVRRLQPNVIINNRVGKGRVKGDSLRVTREGSPGDYGTPEQEVPAQGLPRGVDWEACMTLNGTWGYKFYDDGWKDTRVLIHTLVDIASKGGNYLLNIGPKGDGTIPQPSVSRLREMGEWMKVNGEAIYGTSASPFRVQPAWGRYTSKPGRLYAHVFSWPKNNRLVLTGLKQAPGRVRVLADGEQLETELTAEGVVVKLPAAPPSVIASVLIVETNERF